MGTNQYLSQRSLSEREKIWPSRATGGGRGASGGSLWMGVCQWISSVLGTEKSILLAWAIARMVPKAAWRDRELVRYKREEVVRAKSSTYERAKL